MTVLKQQILDTFGQTSGNYITGPLDQYDDGSVVITGQIKATFDLMIDNSVTVLPGSIIDED